MGAVWLARDEVLNRAVALKRVGATPDGPAPDLARAEREARLAASLNHPHVVAVFDLVHEDDERWLVMEYVEGESLAALVRRDGALPIDRAADLIRQAAEALAAAHAAGIVHRDVKPSNMMVTGNDQVKIADFGIARANADATLTQTGLVTGSPAYLAPEVATGKPASDRSDVWSLGATLFHALDGRPPYDVGNNVMGALYRIVNEDPPRLSTAGWLAPVLEATMATNPENRWSMREVARFLADGPSTQPPPAPVVVAAEATDEESTEVIEPAERPRQRRSGPPPVLLALVVAAVVIGGMFIYFQISSTNSENEPAAGSTTPSATASASPSESVTPSAAPTQEETSGDDNQSDAQAQAMEEFVSNYLSTVTSDPESTWQQLTPDFQQQSGGFEGYTNYWDTIADARVLDISADADAREVTYSVQYTRQDDSTITDVVTLTLEESGGSYLISGEA